MNNTPITRDMLANAKLDSYNKGFESGKANGNYAQYEKGFQEGRQYAKDDLAYIKQDLIRAQSTLQGFREATKLFLNHYEPIESDSDDNDEY